VNDRDAIGDAPELGGRAVGERRVRQLGRAALHVLVGLAAARERL
jgi:hypothetical protein